MPNYKDYSQFDISKQLSDNDADLEKQRDKLNEYLQKGYDTYSKQYPDIKTQDDYNKTINDLMQERPQEGDYENMFGKYADSLPELQKRMKIAPDYLQRNLPQMQQQVWGC